MEALAPPQWAERPRKEGVTLNHTVDKHPPSHCESSRPVESQSIGALSEYQGVQRADLNIPPARETSARVGMVNSDSDDDFQDSREALPTRSSTDPITITMCQQEIEALQNQWKADIQQAIGQAVLEYRDQLSSAQNDLQQKDTEHQQSIQRLQDQVLHLSCL